MPRLTRVFALGAGSARGVGNGLIDGAVLACWAQVARRRAALALVAAGNAHGAFLTLLLERDGTRRTLGGLNHARGVTEGSRRAGLAQSRAFEGVVSARRTIQAVLVLGVCSFLVVVLADLTRLAFMRAG